MEDKEAADANYLRSIEKKKLLSTIEKAGLLSKAEKAGLTLSRVRCRSYEHTLGLPAQPYFQSFDVVMRGQLNVC